MDLYNIQEACFQKCSNISKQQILENVMVMVGSVTGKKQTFSEKLQISAF